MSAKNITAVDNITLDEMRAISEVYRYNQGSPFKVQTVYKIWEGRNNADLDLRKIWEEYLSHLAIYKIYSTALTVFLQPVKDLCVSSPTFEDCLTKTTSAKLTTSAFYLRDVGGRLKNSPFGSDYQNIVLGDKLIAVNSNSTILFLRSPGELRIVDSQNRTTGFVNNELKEEIPNVFYDEEKEVFVMLYPEDDNYRYQVVGTDVGEYGLTAQTARGDTFYSFDATDIPILTGSIHQYSIDWQKLSHGQNGVTMQIDSNGDGIFEKTVIAGNELTPDEIILQTETIVDLKPDSLNLKSDGQDITAYTELPNGYNISDIDPTTVKFNNQISAQSKPTAIGDYNNNGMPDLMVKFDRQAVQNILTTGDEISISVSGNLKNGKFFAGQDLIKVISNGKTVSFLLMIFDYFRNSVSSLIGSII